MIRSLLTFFLSCVSLLVFSQKNFQPGYVLSYKMDTLKGYIDYRNWKVNPDQVLFKGLDGSTMKYKPTDMTSFSVRNEIYVSAKVQVATGNNNLNKLTYDSEPQLEQRWVFLQTIVSGEKSLYFLLTKEGRQQFYIKKNGNFELLIYHQYLLSGTNSIRKDERYRGQLTIYLNDSPAMQSGITRLRYQRNSLEKLFNSYYQKTGKKTDFKNQAEKIKANFGILTGATITSINVESTREDITAPYNSSIDPTLGFYLDLLLARNQRKWAIRNELIYTSYCVDSRFVDYEDENHFSISDVTIGAKQIKLSTLVCFRYPVRKVFITIGGGITNGFAFDLTNEMVIFSKLLTQERTEKKVAIRSTRKYEQGFIASLGVELKRFSSAARYEGSSGISSANNTKIAVNRGYFTVGYRFSK